MPIAGRLTDKTGVGRIVPVGLTLVAAAFVLLTQLSADTSYVLFGVTVFIMGLGMGSAMMPTFSAAMQTLRTSQIAKASTTLNINQQTGASIGTAVMSVLLAHQLASHLSGTAAGGGGGIGATIPAGVREKVAPLMADAFGATFWWAFALVIVALVVAIVLLPKQKPEPIPEDDEQGGESPDAAEAPQLVMH